MKTVDATLSCLYELKRKLEEIVCTSGVDAGVIYKSTESPTYYDNELKCQVYKHEHFSELGDSLVKLSRELDDLINVYSVNLEKENHSD